MLGATMRDKLSEFQAWVTSSYPPEDVKAIEMVADDILDLVHSFPLHVTTVISLTLALAKYTAFVEEHNEDGDVADAAVDLGAGVRDHQGPIGGADPN